MTLKLNIDRTKRNIMLFLLFLAAMNFQAKFFCFVFIALFLLIAIQRKIAVNILMTPYLLLGITMAIYNQDEGVMAMIKCFAYIALYVVGYNMITVHSTEKKYSDYEKVGQLILITISLGSFIHYIINFILNVNEIDNRNTIDVWSGEIMAATGQAILACLMLGLSVSMVYLPRRKAYRALGTVCIVIAMAYNFVLSGRTLIIMLVILFLVGFIFFRRMVASSYERIKLILGIVGGFTLVALILLFNIGGAQDYIKGSLFFDRFTSIEYFLSNSARNSAKISFLTIGWKYPFGGLNMRAEYGYAHDLLLDGYDEYGIMGVIFLLCILVVGIRSLYRLVWRTNYTNELKLSYICVYCSVLLAFTVEPILAGMPWLFTCYSLLNGCMDGMLLVQKKE